MPNNVTYHIARSSEGQVITAFVSGSPPKIAQSDHPNFKAIRNLLNAEDLDDAEILGLFESKVPVKAIESRFRVLSDRVSFKDEKLFFDGDEVHNTVASAILGLMADNRDFMPLVRFLEKLFDNPSEHSRQQAYRWLSSQGLTVTEDGDVVGYKGGSKKGDGIVYSTHKGTAIVDGVAHKGYIPYPIGSVAVMPRSTVVHDPNSTCNEGLHVGTHSYAQKFGDTRFEVHVNPRDIVSVPAGEDEKMRVCRLKVVREVTAKYEAGVRLPAAHLPQEPDDSGVAAQEFSDCDPCPECGGCKTHDECLCEEVARQREVVSKLSEEREAEQKEKILDHARDRGLDWGPKWEISEEGELVANFGSFEQVIGEEDDEEEVEEGILIAQVVGDAQYNNEHVAYFFTPDDCSDQDEVDPTGLRPAVDNVGQGGGLRTLAQSDDEDEEWEEELTEDELSIPPDQATRIAVAEVTKGIEPEDEPEEQLIRHPTNGEYAEMKARAKRRRRNFTKYAQKTGKWTFLGGDAEDRNNWEVSNAND